MESYAQFRERLIVQDASYQYASKIHIRKLYHEAYGEWPTAVDSTSRAIVAPADLSVVVSQVNSHGSLGAIGGFVSFVGWLGLALGVVLIFVELSSRGSLAISATTILLGLLLVANGQFLRVTGEIEQNTQKTALLLERVAAKLLAETDQNPN